MTCPSTLPILIYLCLRSPLIIKDKTFVDSDDEHDPLPTTPTIKKFAVHKLLPKSSPLPIDVELDTGADHFNAQS